MSMGGLSQPEWSPCMYVFVKKGEIDKEEVQRSVCCTDVMSDLDQASRQEALPPSAGKIARPVSHSLSLSLKQVGQAGS